MGNSHVVSVQEACKILGSQCMPGTVVSSGAQMSSEELLELAAAVRNSGAAVQLSLGPYVSADPHFDPLSAGSLMLAIDDDAMAVFADALATSQVLKLSVGPSTLTERGCAALLSAVQRSPSLDTLSFVCALFNGEGADIIASALTPILCPPSPPLCHLRVLRLDGNAFGDPAISALFSALTASAPQAAAAVPRVMPRRGPAPPHMFNALGSLSLRGTGFGAQSCVAFAEAAAAGVFNSLWELVLGFNNIDDAGAVTLSSALRAGHLPSLSSLWVNNNPLGAAAADFEFCGALEVLSLANTSARGLAATSPLVTSLHESTSSLYIDGCASLTATDVDALLDAIATHEWRPRHLGLSGVEALQQLPPAVRSGRRSGAVGVGSASGGSRGSGGDPSGDCDIFSFDGVVDASNSGLDDIHLATLTDGCGKALPKSLKVDRNPLSVKAVGVLLSLVLEGWRPYNLSLSHCGRWEDEVLDLPPLAGGRVGLRLNPHTAVEAETAKARGLLHWFTTPPPPTRSPIPRCTISLSGNTINDSTAFLLRLWLAACAFDEVTVDEDAAKATARALLAVESVTKAGSASHTPVADAKKSACRAATAVRVVSPVCDPRHTFDVIAAGGRGGGGMAILLAAPLPAAAAARSLPISRVVDEVAEQWPWLALFDTNVTSPTSLPLVAAVSVTSPASPPTTAPKTKLSPPTHFVSAPLSKLSCTIVPSGVVEAADRGAVPLLQHISYERARHPDDSFDVLQMSGEGGGEGGILSPAGAEGNTSGSASGAMPSQPSEPSAAAEGVGGASGVVGSEAAASGQREQPSLATAGSTFSFKPVVPDGALSPLTPASPTAVTSALAANAKRYRARLRTQERHDQSNYQFARRTAAMRRSIVIGVCLVLFLLWSYRGWVARTVDPSVFDAVRERLKGVFGWSA